MIVPKYAFGLFIASVTFCSTFSRTESASLVAGVGVERLRTRYGNRQDRGKQPPHFAKASGKILRLILQQGESAELLAKATDGKAKGRILTEKGKKLLEGIKE